MFFVQDFVQFKAEPDSNWHFGVVKDTPGGFHEGYMVMDSSHRRYYDVADIKGAECDICHRIDTRGFRYGSKPGHVICTSRKACSSRVRQQRQQEVRKAQHDAKNHVVTVERIERHSNPRSLRDTCRYEISCSCGGFTDEVFDGLYEDTAVRVSRSIQAHRLDVLEEVLGISFETVRNY